MANQRRPPEVLFQNQVWEKPNELAMNSHDVSRYYILKYCSYSRAISRPPSRSKDLSLRQSFWYRSCPKGKVSTSLARSICKRRCLTSPVKFHLDLLRRYPLLWGWPSCNDVRCLYCTGLTGGAILVSSAPESKNHDSIFVC